MTKNEELENILHEKVYDDSRPDFNYIWGKLEIDKIFKEEHMPEKKGGSKILVWVVSFVVVAAIGWYGLTKISTIKNNEKIEKGEAIVVSLVVGDVQVKKMGSTGWRVINVEDTLQMGDTVKTGADSYCELQMVNRGLFRIEGASQLYLATLVSKDDKVNSRMKLDKGTVALKPNKLKEGENFEVETSTAVAAVRGTKFSVNVGENGDTKVAVDEGKVAVKPVIKSIDEAQQKGTVDAKASEILKTEIEKPVEVNPGEEINLETKKVEAMDKSVEKVIDQVSTKQEGKQITEDTLSKVTVTEEKTGKGKTVEKEVTGSEMIAIKVQEDLKPEVVNKAPVNGEESIVGSIVQKQEISEDSKKTMDNLNESNIINKVADMVIIRFESTPAGADVYMDDVKLGVSPLNTLVERGKIAKIRMTRDGYTEDVKEVTIGGNLTVNSILTQVQTIQTNETNQTNAIVETNTNSVKTNAPQVTAEVKKLPGELDWQKPLAMKIESAYKEPADPVVYGGKIFLTKNNRLFIVSLEGKLLKSVAVVEDGVKLTRPSVSDGIVYVGSDNGGVYAYSTHGDLMWKKDAGSEKYGASPTAANGIVAVPSIDKGIMIFDKTGELLTQIESDSVYSAPLILNDGKTLIYATESGNIVSYDIEGKSQNWSKGYNERFLYPLVGDETIIAIARASGKVLAVKPADGSILWTEVFDEIQKTRINPRFVAGKLILANNDTKSMVFVVDAMSGRVISKTSFDNETIVAPFILDKFVYIGTESGKVYSYNVNKKKYEWTYKSSGNAISLVVADKDGIYALSLDGMLRIVK